MNSNNVFYLTLHIQNIGGTVVKNLLANAGISGLIPGLGRFPGVGNSNPLQCSYLENFMDRGASRMGYGESNTQSN